MPPSSGSLGRRVATNTSAAIIDLLLTKVANVLVFVLLVRILGTAEIAAIGVATGYLVFLLYLDVSPIRVMLRDYPRLSQDVVRTNRLLSALSLFWIGQCGAMVLVCAFLVGFVLPRLSLPALAFLYVALTIDFIALTLRDWVKTLYYADLRHGTATKISIAENAVRLSCLLLILYLPHIETYAWLLIALAIGSGAVWVGALLAHFRFRPIFDRHTLPLLKHSLTDYGLWDHLNRTAIDTLLTIDTIILSWYAEAPEIAAYAIALRFTSLLLLLPTQLHRGLQVALSNVQTEEKRAEAANTALKLCAAIGLAQLLAVALAGDWILWVLFGASATREVYVYAVIITVAVTAMIPSWPVLSIINNFASLREAFRLVFLPAMLVGLPMYVLSAAYAGGLGMALAKVVVYAGLGGALMLFCAKKCPFPLQVTVLSPREKALMRELFWQQPLGWWWRER